jgi:signal peptidase I
VSKTKIQTNVDLDQGTSTDNLLWEILKTVGVFLVAIIIFRFYIFQPFLVKGTSMEPNFHDGQYLVVNELAYHLGSPKRGDVVVFKHPEPACTDFIEANYINQVFLQGPCTNYIKRVVGVPGETVIVKDGKVYVKNEKNPNGFELDEKYIVSGTPTLGDQTRTLGKDEYFVLGDNRYPNASSDSREWGVLPRKNITGKAAFILYPFDDLTVVKRASYAN